MIKRILLTCIISLLSTFIAHPQKIERYDMAINMHHYVACYSWKIETSSFVVYKLYKGGGQYPRSAMKFVPYKNLPHFNYSNSKYDKGHLVPAKDFSKNRSQIKSTFYYVNCIPQHPNLNRGIWKTYEEKIRKLSQTDSLLIVCGGCDYVLRDTHIPKNCFKIVYDLRTRKCVCSLLFTNDKNSILTINDKLRRKITFKIAYEIYAKHIK